MSEGPRCPACETEIGVDWDWCWRCGFDPDGLRPDGQATPSNPRAADPPTAWAPPTPIAAPAAQPAPSWSIGTPPNAQLPPPIGFPGPSAAARPRPISRVWWVAASASAALVLVVVGAVVFVGRTPPPKRESADSGPGIPVKPTTSSTARTGSQSPAPDGATGDPSANGPGVTAGLGTPATPAAMFTKPRDPARVIDEATASAVFEAWWPVRADGWKRHDRALLASVESGAALDWDAVSCIGCTTTIGERVDAPRFTAPEGSSYPAYFLAQIHSYDSSTDDAGRPVGAIETNLAVFRRASAEVPWLAVLVTGNGNRGSVIPPTTASSFDRPAPQVTGSIDPRQLPDRLAEYYDSYKRTGAAPSGTPFYDNGGLAEDGRSVYEFHRQILDMGVRDDTLYRSGADEDGYYAFDNGSGSVLACSTIRWKTEDVPEASGGAITVEPDGPFPLFMAPGRYARIDKAGVRQVCFLVTIDCRCLTVIGRTGGTYDANGPPA